MAFLVKFKFVLVIGILLGGLFFVILNIFTRKNFTNRTQRIGIAGRYTADKLPEEILNMIGDGLTQVDEAGNVIPNLAESWETPDKGKTWIFHLKKGLFWQDKKPVTSADINYQFSDLVTEKPDESTIIYKLTDSYSAFPAVVSRPIFKKGLLGTGDWMVDKIKLSRNFVSEIALKNSGKIIFKFYPSEDQLKIAFKLGEVDEIRGLIDPAPFHTWPKVKLEKKVDRGKLVGIFLNTEKPLLSDKTFRQSLAYAINKDSLSQERAISPISINSWAYNPQVKPYNYDPQKAKNGIKDNPEITLLASPALIATAEKVAEDWKQIGIKTTVQFPSTIPDDYQALLVIFDIPEDPDQYSIWHSTQKATNITKYANPRIDKLLEDGRIETNLEERRKIYLDFQRFLLEDSPAIFLYYPTTYTIKR